MKNFKTTHAVLICIAVLLIGITAFSFHPNKKVRTDYTDYYWFDASGNYLRQNLIDDEIDYTGYDEFPYAPFTIQEKGYTPASVYGNPPVPYYPHLPAKRLYSHP